MRLASYHVNGAELAAWTAGEGPRLALLLHGFPDDPGCWAPLIERLMAEGWRVVAPYLRGYGRSTGRGGDYGLARLANDAVGLIRACDVEQAVVIGHDWGAAIGYAAANLAPERVSHLLALSVPPPRAFLRNLRRDPAQLRRSWYMGFFQLPLLPERALVRHNYALIDRFWREWSPGWTPPPERLADVKRTFDYPGTVEAALGYYRALLPRATPLRWRRNLRLALGRLRVPTRILAGARDGGLGLALFQDLDDCFRAPFRCTVLDAGHWLPLEATEQVHAELRELVAGDSRPQAPRGPRRLPVVG